MTHLIWHFSDRTLQCCSISCYLLLHELLNVASWAAYQPMTRFRWWRSMITLLGFVSMFTCCRSVVMVCTVTSSWATTALKWWYFTLMCFVRGHIADVIDSVSTPKQWAVDLWLCGSNLVLLFLHVLDDLHHWDLGWQLLGEDFSKEYFFKWLRRRNSVPSGNSCRFLYSAWN